MPAKKKESPPTSATKGSLTETGIRVGKALARSTFKVEDSTRRAKQAAENLVGTVARKTGLDKKSPYRPAEGLTVQAQIGFLAGDILQFLTESGATTPEKLLLAMAPRKHSQPMVHAALGWLARENKISFSPDGGTVMKSP